MLLSSDGTNITGAWFSGQAFFPCDVNERIEANLPVFDCAKEWLDIYFSGKDPNFSIPLKFDGTQFQIDIWNILLTIPYGKIISYADIANSIAKARGISKMSNRAVGRAIGRNKISIFVPCHRVIGKDGKLTGYAGGLERKSKLLSLEKTTYNYEFKG